jgi:plastocyanin
MSASRIPFPNFSKREIPAKNAAKSCIGPENTSQRNFVLPLSSSTRAFGVFRSKQIFAYILRLPYKLSSLFLASLFPRTTCELLHRKVCLLNFFYRFPKFLRVPARGKTSCDLQEGSVTRFHSPVSATIAESPHPQLLFLLLAFAMACCFFLLVPAGPHFSQLQLAPSPSSLAYRLDAASPFELRSVHSYFASPATFFAPADPSSPGTLNGRVTYDGTPKKLRPIDMSAEPNCAKFYNTPPMPEVSLTGSDNSLQNVIVYVSAGAPDENFTGPVVHLNQRGCRYTPHIIAVQANQEVWVQNDDTVTHSVHPMAHSNAEWNRSQPPGTPPVVIRYSQPEFIRVKCELHPWMRGVLAVFKNSHHAVTDSTGAFTLAELPPGKYTITAWHEVYGTQSKEVTIAAGQNLDLNFVFKVTPY